MWFSNMEDMTEGKKKWEIIESCKFQFCLILRQITSSTIKIINRTELKKVWELGWTHTLFIFRCESRGAEMGEFSPPFFWAPSFFFFISLEYWNNIWFLWHYYKNSPPISKSWIRPWARSLIVNYNAVAGGCL